MTSTRCIFLSRRDLTLLRDMVQLSDTSRAETLEAILDELLASNSDTEFSLLAEEG